MKDKKEKEPLPADIYPGAATDIADDEKVDAKLVEQETKLLNDNPHTDGD